MRTVNYRIGIRGASGVLNIMLEMRNIELRLYYFLSDKMSLNRCVMHYSVR